jgi:hypothetical protein
MVGVGVGVAIYYRVKKENVVQLLLSTTFKLNSLSFIIIVGT